MYNVAYSNLEQILNYLATSGNHNHNRDILDYISSVSLGSSIPSSINNFTNSQRISKYV